MIKYCTACEAEFSVIEQDLSFYDKVSPVFKGDKFLIPPPSLCPACRYQRRLAFRNERHFYQRKCDLTGREMLSMHHSSNKFPVYYITDWLGEGWNPLSYGRDYDFSRPFFTQFQELAEVVPHFNLFIDPTLDVNSEYTNCASESKHCYLITQAEKNEDCYYSRGINNSRDCVDCLRIDHCELCYEGINLANCYHCLYCQDVVNSSDCYFSTELVGCRYCFGCHGLRQKEYYLFNQPVGKEEWQKKVEELVFTPEIIQHLLQQSQESRLRTSQLYAHLRETDDSTGDHLANSRHAHSCFDSVGLEECKFCYEVHTGIKDVYDFSMFGLNCELMYECNGCGYNVYNTIFANHCWQNVTNVLYSESCFPNVKDLFGCFGLRNAQYCILNKQYAREEYEDLVVKIIEQMRTTGEWGEFFPVTTSPYAYNESLAQEFFPLSAEQVKAKGWSWYAAKAVERHKKVPAESLANSSSEVPDDILQTVLECVETHRPYKIQPGELAFYRKMKLPIPTRHPDERHRRRMALRNPNILRTAACTSCGKAIETTYPAETPYQIYCEECYLKEVRV